MRVAVVAVVLALGSPAAFAKQCVKGKPCGNTCISWADTCHVPVTQAPPACTTGKPCGDTCISWADTCHIPRVTSPYVENLERKRQRSRELRESMQGASEQFISGLESGLEMAAEQQQLQQQRDEQERAESEPLPPPDAQAQPQAQEQVATVVVLSLAGALAAVLAGFGCLLCGAYAATH